MREGVLKKNESNTRSAAISHSPSVATTTRPRQTCTETALSGEKRGAARAAGRTGVTPEAAGDSGGLLDDLVSVDDLAEVMKLRRKFVPEGIVKLPELRLVMNIKDVARTRNGDILDPHDAAWPRAHQHHAVGKADRLRQVV